ncbi:transcription antitermination factor NusB [Hoeflea alexandrii]|uniref:Transcription antitermination protein NusB n=1 Tax=Hoeflea alexandrii TaxID=288436 RepID=A0ABT1CV12_9HYPH|nr:transcription antitermination factor NusB [Hoeflea alexandrii]
MGAGPQGPARQGRLCSARGADDDRAERQSGGLNVATEDTSSPSAPEPEIKSANQRGAARLAAVQALYQMDIGGAGVLEIVAEYEAHRLGSEIDGEQYRPADPAWFRAVVSGVVDNQRALDPVIRSGLTEDWPLSRLDATLRAILRAGAWELSAKKDVPVAVVVNEYVDVARAFFDGEEPKIVNAVLDRLARKYRGDQNPGKD